MPEHQQDDGRITNPVPKMSYSRQCLTIIFPHPFTKLYVVINFARIVSLPQYRHISPLAVLLIVQKRAQSEVVESFSPHDFRRTFCSDLLDAGVDIVTVQKLAGHASPVTTAKYDRRGRR